MQVAYWQCCLIQFTIVRLHHLFDRLRCAWPDRLRIIGHLSFSQACLLHYCACFHYFNDNYCFFDSMRRRHCLFHRIPCYSCRFGLLLPWRYRCLRRLSDGDDGDDSIVAICEQDHRHYCFLRMSLHRIHWMRRIRRQRCRGHRRGRNRLLLRNQIARNAVIILHWGSDLVWSSCSQRVLEKRRS